MMASFSLMGFAGAVYNVRPPPHIFINASTQGVLYPHHHYCFCTASLNPLSLSLFLSLHVPPGVPPFAHPPHRRPQPILAALGITVANLNKGRTVFYFILLVAMSLLFDFIQMCINQGVGFNNNYPNNGSHVFGLVMMVFNFIVKIMILFCANKHFGQLGGTWAFSANFAMGDGSGAGDSAYANMSADGNGATVEGGLGGEGSSNVSYQDHSYKSPPATAGSSTTQHL
jgi:hypothetical protein